MHMGMWMAAAMAVLMQAVTSTRLLPEDMCGRKRTELQLHDDDRREGHCPWSVAGNGLLLLQHLTSFCWMRELYDCHSSIVPSTCT